MLQIIGWLGCVYLVVKALEIAGSNAFRNDKGQMTGGAIGAVAVAWIAVAVFAVLFWVQGQEVTSAVDDFSSSYDSEPLAPPAEY